MIAIGLVGFASGLLWLLTGRDPLWWAIRALIAVRAGLWLAGSIGYYAGREWWRALPRTIKAMRAEVTA